MVKSMVLKLIPIADGITHCTSRARAATLAELDAELATDNTTTGTFSTRAQKLQHQMPKQRHMHSILSCIKMPKHQSARHLLLVSSAQFSAIYLLHLLISTSTIYFLSGNQNPMKAQLSL